MFKQYFQATFEGFWALEWKTPIYRRLFHVPKGGGKSGFYCIYIYVVPVYM
jgi:hypothetical protein